MKRPWALPLVPFYAAGVALRSLGLRVGLEQVQRLAWPVISVGNLSAGGTGKTPFVIALAQLLRREGIWLDVLSRGYGRVGKSPSQVQADGDAEIYGDEPLLIARETVATVFVGARRWEAGRLAEALGSQPALHLLDDGFQHRQLARDIDIVLVNSEDLEDSLLPAGNLREGVRALNRATVLAVPSGDDAAVAALRGLGMHQPIWRFRREMNMPEVAGSVVAFCGIARPGQFFSGLEAMRIEIASRMTFRDHHRFTARDVATLGKLVQSTGARTLVTTEKDSIRLGSLTAELERFASLIPVNLRIVLEDEAEILSWLKHRIPAH